MSSIRSQINYPNSVEIEFDDEIRAMIVLAFLPNCWEDMRMAMSIFARKSKLKYNDIRDLILSEEIYRRDASINNAQEQAFVIESKSKGINRGPNDRAKFNDRSQSRDRSQFKETRECFYCGKNCHIRKNCWHWNKE